MKPFAFDRTCGGFWFRVFGVGISCEDRRVRQAPFSERYGLAPVVRVGRWSIRWLRRMP